MNINPDHYEARPCPRCAGTGVHRDITLAGTVNGHADYLAGICSRCQGEGVTYHITAAGLAAEAGNG